MLPTVSAVSNVGKRNHNEDAFCVAPEHGVFVVADGMGGHASGEVASVLTVETIRDFFVSHAEDEAITWPWGMDSGMSLTENKLSVAVRLANRAVMEGQSAHGQMGTTVVAMIEVDDRLVIGHIGDSRAYLLRDGTLSQLTRDHSMCNMMRDMGQEVTDEVVARYNNIITRAIGMIKESDDRPDITSVVHRPGDLILLSTDGLHDYVEGEALIELLSLEDGQEACDRLVERAMEGGSSDNITAVLVRY